VPVVSVGFEARNEPVTQVQADLLVVPCFAGPGSAPEPGPGAAEVAAALGVDVATALGPQRFAGEIGGVFGTLTLDRLGSPSVLFVGLGPRDAAGPDAVRQAAMRAAGRMSAAARIAVVLPDPNHAGTDQAGTAQAAAEAFAEGLLLGAYRFDRYRHRPVTPGWGPPVLEEVRLLTGGASVAAVNAGLRRGQAIASLTNWVRDLVNASPSDTTPDDMAGRARQLAELHGLSYSVLTGAGLAAGGFGGICGVGKGSRNEPRLVELSYRGGGDSPVLGLTGKGITFDSGGLTLKRSAEIEWMKSDMAGAASIMAVVRGAAEFGLPVNIDAVLPFAENMPGGAAQRPGDVLTHRGGKTSEVRDTDAEGRLIVADALAYLAERNPAVLVDVATLTDAAGLGEALWAVLGTDKQQIGALIEAGRDAGDPGWQLPLPTAYRKYLASAVADVRNTPSGVPDTTVMAAMYLREFTGDVPWMHIDNGSTAYLDRQGDLWPEGATGSPVRALLRWVERLAGRQGAEHES
jgi:leucyl aminopeptidase